MSTRKHRRKSRYFDPIGDEIIYLDELRKWEQDQRYCTITDGEGTYRFCPLPHMSFPGPFDNLDAALRIHGQEITELKERVKVLEADLEKRNALGGLI